MMSLASQEVLESSSSCDDLIDLNFDKAGHVGNKTNNKSTTNKNNKRRKKTSSTTAKKRKIADEIDDNTCPICLAKIRALTVATPDKCQHSFCIKCLVNWAKNVKTCPLDRNPFTYIIVKERLTGNVVKHCTIDKWGNLIKLPKCDDLRLQRLQNNLTRSGKFCDPCGSTDRMDMSVTCDKCLKNYHMECLPSGFGVTISIWLCPSCEMYRDEVSNQPPDRGRSTQRCMVLQRCRNNTLRSTRTASSSTQRPNNQLSPTRGSPEPTTSQENNNNNDNNRSSSEVLGRILEIQSRTYSECFNRHSAVETRRDNNHPSSSNNDLIVQTSSGESNGSGKLGNPRFVQIEIIAKEMLDQLYRSRQINKEKWKQVMKAVVPKVYKDTTPSTNLVSLKEIISEQITLWMEILL